MNDRPGALGKAISQSRADGIGTFFPPRNERALRAVTLVARCKHCDAQRTWEQLPDGSVVAPLTNVGAGAKRYSYPCAASDDERCEPLILTAGDRMVRELAGMRRTRKRR
jgi:hypothetical protein